MSSQTLRVTKFEIVRQLKKPAFWAATLLIPILIGVLYIVSFISSGNVGEAPTFDENTKIAITDEAEILSENISFVTQDEKEENIEKIKNGEIDLYYYIPADFVESKKAEFYHVSEGLEIFNRDGEILKQILMQDVSTRVDAEDALAMTGNYDIDDHKLTAGGEESNALGKAIIPLFIGIVFFIFIMLCGNRFLMTVVEEKENRISEMILTAISSKHLIVGKILALLTLGLIQIAVLVIPVVALVLFNRDQEIISQILSIIVVDPLSVVLSIVLFIASAIFFAGVCTFVGSVVSTARDASSFLGPTIIVIVLPLYFMQAFMTTEPSMMVQFLTYCPFTAPVALMLRNGFGTLTTTEFCIGVTIVIVSAVVAIYLAVKTFQKNTTNFEIAKPKFLRR